MSLPYSVRSFGFGVALVLGGLACSAPPSAGPSSPDTDGRDSQDLRPSTSVGLGEHVDFPVGVAVPAGSSERSVLVSSDRAALVENSFDGITAENIMKLDALHPEPDRYDFAAADALVDWARSRDLVVHGHTLVWHSQIPAWMESFEGDWTAMMEDHVRTVAGHFAGRVVSWDVVNEAFEDDPPGAWRETLWYRNVGRDYVERAFRVAREADPEAVLYYNDYDISGVLGPGKLDGVLAMVDDLRSREVPIDGVGFQMHIDIERPSLAEIRDAFERVVERGLRVRISELDVSVNPSAEESELTAELERRQAERYRAVAEIYRDTVPPPLRGGITVWGIRDDDSWIPGFKERPDWPLLFDAEGTPKPAYHAFAGGLGGESGPSRSRP